MLETAIVTLFPELFGEFVRTSLVGRAVSAGHLSVAFENLRDHGLGKHRAVDDTPYGGGAGMLLRVDCVAAAIDAAVGRMQTSPRRVLLTPQGRPFVQATAERWSRLPSLLFVCGRYEGFDERVRGLVDEEASLGDFVLIGGEVAVMAMIEATSRLIPGVLGNHESTKEESFASPDPETDSGSTFSLEYPQYTRPAEFRGQGVPEVLKNGNHAEIDDWRRVQAHSRTAERRPDLLSPSGRAGAK
ncbi:MAG: hypothetical protein RJA70_2812 [Pseudomonadota bacterium]|jgi:tRNA (guanine37-N1)-methyltransferase